MDSSIKFGPTAHFEASINGLPEAVETGHEHPRWTLPIQQCNQFKGEHLLPVDQKAELDHSTIPTIVALSRLQEHKV